LEFDPKIRDRKRSKKLDNASRPCYNKNGFQPLGYAITVAVACFRYSSKGANVSFLPSVSRGGDSDGLRNLRTAHAVLRSDTVGDHNGHRHPNVHTKKEITALTHDLKRLS